MNCYDSEEGSVLLKVEIAPLSVSDILKTLDVIESLSALCISYWFPFFQFSEAYFIFFTCHVEV